MIRSKWFGRGSSQEDIRFSGRNMKVVDDVVLVKKGAAGGVELGEANFIVP